MLARKPIKRSLKGKESLQDIKSIGLVSVIDTILPLPQKAKVQLKVMLSLDGISINCSLENKGTVSQIRLD